MSGCDTIAQFRRNPLLKMDVALARREVLFLKVAVKRLRLGERITRKAGGKAGSAARTPPISRG